MMKISMTKRRKCVSFVLLILVCLGYGSYVLLMATQPVHFLFRSDAHGVPCTLPSIDPFDKTLAKFFWKPEPLVCDFGPRLILVDHDNTLRINTSALGFYKIDDASKIVCEVREVIRVPNDEDVTFSEARTVFKLPHLLKSDFNHVVCRTKTNDVVYDNVVHGITYDTVKQVGPESESHLSVLLFGIDSVSRSAAFRYLPKTMKYLAELGAYDFRGYMKVGDNTFPNLVPLLTGREATEEECPGFATTRFDDYPFLWRNFSTRDYVTMFAEDTPHMNMFNNGFKGFKKRPTDHYMRPFWLGLSSHDAIQYKLSNIYRFLEDKGVKMKKSSVFCNQDTPNHSVLVNYLRQFFRFYKGKRKFAASFLTELAHNFINFLNYGDDVFTDFLKWLQTEGFLNSTMIVFYSDHGSRFENIRNTYVGRIESRMPLLSIVIPEQLKMKHPKLHKSMQENTQRLVTVHDIHQTLVDVVTGSFDKPSTQFVKERTRGISLFQTISKDRSCHDAWIPGEFCACYKATPVDVENDPEVYQIAEKIVDYINSLLKEHKQCGRLELSKVISAEQSSLGLKHVGTSHNKYSFFRNEKPENNRRRYTVSLETVPGHGLFDASCEFTTVADFKVIGSVDRTNKYGNQSICVDDKSLKQYCYCVP